MADFPSAMASSSKLPRHSQDETIVHFSIHFPPKSTPLPPPPPPPSLSSPVLAVRKPTIKQLDQPPKGARPRLTSTRSSPNLKALGTTTSKKKAPTPLDLGDENVPLCDSPLQTTLSSWRSPLGSSENVPRPLPTVASSSRSVRPLPSIPSTSSTMFPSTPYAPQSTSQSATHPIRPLPRPPATPPRNSAEFPVYGSDSYPESSLSSSSSPASSTQIELPLPEDPPPPPLPPKEIDPEPSPSHIPSVNVEQPNTLVKGQPLLHLDVSPKTLRRLKGAAVSATEIERSILAEMVRQHIPEEFFCEAILARTKTPISSEDECELVTPITPLESRRNTIVSIVSTDDGYEIALRVDGDSEDLEDEEDGEIVTWDWVVSRSAAQAQPNRFSTRWFREKDGKLVEEDYEKVIKLLRAL